MFKRITMTVLSVLVSGCATHLDYRDFADPVLYVNQRSGYCVPIPCKNYYSGLLVMVWRDGRILRAVSPELTGQQYILGRLSSQDKRTLDEIIKALSETTHEMDGAAVDTSTRLVELILDPDDVLGSKTWFYGIEHIREGRPDFLPEQAVEQLMQLSIEAYTELEWHEIPRFAPPVFGKP